MEQQFCATRKDGVGMYEHYLEIQTSRDVGCGLRKAGRRYWSEIEWRQILNGVKTSNLTGWSKALMFGQRIELELRRRLESATFVFIGTKDNCSYYRFYIQARTPMEVATAARELAQTFFYIIESFRVTSASA